MFSSEARISVAVPVSVGLGRAGWPVKLAFCPGRDMAVQLWYGVGWVSLVSVGVDRGVHASRRVPARGVGGMLLVLVARDFYVELDSE